MTESVHAVVWCVAEGLTASTATSAGRAPTYVGLRVSAERSAARRTTDAGRHYGVAYEPVSRARVLERDNWTCRLCGQRISKRAQYPDLMSASLDHIVPLSKGGGHLYSNVQAAHFICNSKKSDGERVLLVG